MSSNKNEVKEIIIELVETVDNMIPVVGHFMDIPIVDKMEACVISMAVDALYDFKISESTIAADEQFMNWSA